MAEPEPVVIIGVGARTPVGFTAASSAAAVRAGISVIEEHPFMIDRFGEPMKVTRDVGLDVAVTGAARAIEIGLDAAREALAVLDGRDAPPVSVLVSTGEDRPGQPPGHAAAVFAGLAERLAATVRIDRGGYLAAGHAGGLLAMLRARDALRTGRVRLCLVGGVDSYLEAETLEWLDETEQLHSEGNIYGFCPGEGAGFCLMSTLATARALGCRPFLELVSIAGAREENRIRTETVCLGIGLGTAFRLAFEEARDGIGPVDRILCDMNGERYRGNEYGFAVLRNSGRLRDAGDFETPADCWGDLGAASGPAFVGLLTEAEARSYTKGALSLAWASSDSGSRAAALLRGPGRAG
ncbi:MAG TPA: beta-ketoacyl synthase N-terminal-like domain-containing protein [Amaricoccus sp.]|nr:beta-ketoacyl synthase N-terminal-like domain-containing protein [Amaricoccus sp.]